ncbi:MAG TPA: hypothetical protein VFB45_04095 [Pseudolabrys sp.]|nr:hypothetical protein [Pseudolabrys sp.]
MPRWRAKRPARRTKNAADFQKIDAVEMAKLWVMSPKAEPGCLKSELRTNLILMVRSERSERLEP